MLAERLNEAVRRAHAVGAVGGTVHKGARKFAVTGVADAGTGAVMTEATSLRIASITKPIVTTAVYPALRDEPCGAISRAVAFGGITRLTGRPRPHRGSVRLAAEYARLGLATLR